MLIMKIVRIKVRTILNIFIFIISVYFQLKVILKAKESIQRKTLKVSLLSLNIKSNFIKF